MLSTSIFASTIKKSRSFVFFDTGAIKHGIGIGNGIGKVKIYT